MEKNKDFHESKIQDSRALGATSRVVLELKSFGILIREPIVSEPWVGRNTGKMSRNSIAHCSITIRVPKHKGSQGMRGPQICGVPRYEGSPGMRGLQV